MKYIENSKMWDLIISGIDKVINTNVEIKEDVNILEEKCSKLASYSYESDIKTGKITEHNLFKMEGEGLVFGINLIIRIKRYYYILAKIKDLNYSKHIQLLTNLIAYLGNQYYYKAEESTIEQLLIYGLMFPDFLIDPPQVQLDRMIESAKFLKKYNIIPEIQYSGFLCSEANTKKIFNLLEQKIMYVGGHTVLEKIYTEFFAMYIPQFDFYFISRNSRNKRNEPLNLLLNLSIKHLRPNFGQRNLSSECVIQEIFQIARAWLDILDIQSESTMEYSMMKTENFPLYFNNEIVFDKMCMPKQYSKKFILLLLDKLIKPFFVKSERKYSFKEYLSIADYLMSLNQPYLLLNLNEVHKQTGVAYYKIKIILEDISKPKNQVNSQFNSLEDKVNYYTRPLIKYSLDQYLYVDYHFTGFGFYLAAYDMIKANYDILDRKLGLLVEEMMRAEISKKGYSSYYGKYTTLDDESDCDLVMRNSNRICLFEIKKAEIENEFNILDDVAALHQLSKGMIKAQKQTFRHKRNLHKYGNLTLKSEQGETNITCDNENIYMFSVCLPEYSFLTSKSFSSKLLEVISLGGFSTVDPNRQSEVKELNDLGKTILQYANEINNCAPIDVHSLSFYSAFVSAQQLLIALWCSNSEEEFLETIRNWIYGTDGSLNLYHSILCDIEARDNSKRIRKSTIDMFEKNKKEAVFVG